MEKDLHKTAIIILALRPDYKAFLSSTQCPKRFKRNILFPSLNGKFNAIDSIILNILNTVFLPMN